MRLLAFDTTGTWCSVAACNDRQVVAGRREHLGIGHAERIVAMIGEVMAEAAWSWDEVDLIVPAIGPGSFTGIRAGLAAARGLALATGRPTLGVSSLEAQAAASDAAGPVVAVIPGRGQTLFAQRFDAGGAPAGEPLQLTRESLASLCREGDEVLGDDAEIDGLAVAKAALRRLARGDRPVPGHRLHALYLREPGAALAAGRPLVGAAA